MDTGHAQEWRGPFVIDLQLRTASKDTFSLPLTGTVIVAVLTFRIGLIPGLLSGALRLSCGVSQDAFHAPVSRPPNYAVARPLYPTVPALYRWPGTAETGGAPESVSGNRSRAAGSKQRLQPVEVEIAAGNDANDVRFWRQAIGAGEQSGERCGAGRFGE